MPPVDPSAGSVAAADPAARGAGAPGARRGRAPFVPIVPAGGAGTRLWPLSRRARPKFLLDLTGTGSSLLQRTIERVAPLADRPPIVVTGAVHEAAVREQLGERARVFAEPSPRNSMPAIALAAAVALREDPDAVIGSFAADHLVEDTAAFAEAVERARAAAELGMLVTIGIEPTGPATGFGYIETADAEADGACAAQGGASLASARPGGAAPGGDAALADRLRSVGALPVVRFVEKPDRETAEAFVASGRFRWNAGMFVVRAQVLLDALAEQLPTLAAGAREIAAALAAAEADERADATADERSGGLESARGDEREPADERGAETLERVWPTLTRISIDHALAEPLAAAGRVAVVPGSFGWDDVGDFAALARQLRGPGGEDAPTGGGQDVVSLGGAETVAVGARATVYGSPGRLVALVGVDGVSVVDTDDALLVLGDARAQDLSALGDLLEAIGRGELR